MNENYLYDTAVRRACTTECRSAHPRTVLGSDKPVSGLCADVSYLGAVVAIGD